MRAPGWVAPPGCSNIKVSWAFKLSPWHLPTCLLVLLLHVLAMLPRQCIDRSWPRAPAIRSSRSNSRVSRSCRCSSSPSTCARLSLLHLQVTIRERRLRRVGSPANARSQKERRGLSDEISSIASSITKFINLRYCSVGSVGKGAERGRRRNDHEKKKSPPLDGRATRRANGDGGELDAMVATVNVVCQARSRCWSCDAKTACSLAALCYGESALPSRGHAVGFAS